MDTRALAKIVCEALEDKKAFDVKAIDISEISPIADYFIVASASNQNQLLALQDAADEAMYKNGIHAKNIEGNRASTWILLDYEDIVIHLFSQQDRAFYDLERIWKDGIILSTEEL